MNVKKSIEYEVRIEIYGLRKKNKKLRFMLLGEIELFF